MAGWGAEKWLFPLFSAAFVSLLLTLSAISGFTASYTFLYSRHSHSPSPLPRRGGASSPPSFAYYLSGSRGDRDRLLRLLLSLYHPRNRYLLHLSFDASSDERRSLAAAARAAAPASRVFGNVDVLASGDPNTDMGSSVLAATLHAAAVLLRMDPDWDWFVALNAADYPLVTQDDLVHVFSTVPRDLNFIDHTSELGWKNHQRVQPIVVDPATYLARRAQIFRATERRPTPESFKLFTGSPWVVLSRRFLEFCILGWDNLPRTLLMYFTNVMIPQEGYFQSLVCNAEEFKNTTVNNDLRYMVWDKPPKMEPHFLGIQEFDGLDNCSAPFARKFHKNDPVLSIIDERILGRRHYRVVPGAWCSGRDSWWSDPCSQWNDVNSIRPGPRAEKLGELMKKLLDDLSSGSNSCA